MTNTEKAGDFNKAFDAVHETLQDSDKDLGAETGSSAATSTRSRAEQAADKLYEERIEDEHAKRK